ncbi:MAG: hypothetical protein IMZ58_10015 [Thermoplasmata archaeon]|nr:hypothetical protein [Thermoplasmata archaeon]
MQEKSRIKLEHVELFYKFALAASSPVNSRRLNYLDTFSYLKHVVKKNEVKLTASEEKTGARILEHVGTYMMMLQLNKVLEDEWGKNRLQSKDNDIQNISQVVRLIRNAFAHDPFEPCWNISNSSKNKEFEIPGILTLKTVDLHGKKLERKHYGGPLALLRLLQFTKKKLEKSTT